MKSFVVDASVTLAWCLPGQATSASENALKELGAGVTALAPCIWPGEVANGIWSAERRGELSRSQAVGILNLLRSLPVMVDHQLPVRVFDAVRELASQYDITVYDASYLDTALREQLPLATLDRALLRAAREAGGKVVT